MDADTALPRAYSIGQPDFDPEIGRRLRIRVDGVEQQKVIEYDCDAGTVLKNMVDQHGNIMLNAKRDEIMRETVRGNVTVEWNDGGY